MAVLCRLSGTGLSSLSFFTMPHLWEAGTLAPYTTDVRLLNKFLGSVWDRKSSQEFADRPGQGLGTSLRETAAEGICAERGR